MHALIFQLTKQPSFQKKLYSTGAKFFLHALSRLQFFGLMILILNKTLQHWLLNTVEEFKTHLE